MKEKSEDGLVAQETWRGDGGCLSCCEDKLGRREEGLLEGRTDKIFQAGSSEPLQDAQHPYPGKEEEPSSV